VGATSREVSSKTIFEAKLRCDTARPTLLRVKYRVAQAEVNTAFIVQVALLPQGSSNPTSDELNKYTLGLITPYQMPPPSEINEAVFSLPEWFCSSPGTSGKLLMHMLPPQPQGKPPASRVQVVDWRLE
jgi:hypothetical protein